MKSITVFCGSSAGNNPVFKETAYQLGQVLASKNITVIYGGAKVGLMGAVANGALDHHGKVIGVLPHFLKAMEVAHEGLSELILVESMHDRKTKMSDMCEGMITLPGGFGSMEELFEVLTWSQLGLHQKPVAILNLNGFYDPLLAMIDSMVDAGFLKQANQEMLLVSDDIEELLAKMQAYTAPSEGKWIKDA